MTPATTQTIVLTGGGAGMICANPHATRQTIPQSNSATTNAMTRDIWDSQMDFYRYAMMLCGHETPLNRK